MTFEQLKTSARPTPKRPYVKYGFWNNQLNLQHDFCMSFSYSKPVTRELLDKMKAINETVFYKVINNELSFEQAEGYRSQVWDLLTEEERSRCIDFHSDLPIQTISEAALGCGDDLGFGEPWGLDSPFSQEALDTIQRLEGNNKNIIY